MVLKRPEICEAIGFNSWTAVQVWLDDVVSPAFDELIRDYLEPFAVRGQRNPPGTRETKDYFISFASDLDRVVERRVSELEQGLVYDPNKTGCKIISPIFWFSVLPQSPNVALATRAGDTRQHYEHFIIEALAMDRLTVSPYQNHISTKEWADEPISLFATMFELTDTICHNYWKPAESEMWDSDDSDVPYTDGRDLPYARSH